MSEWGFISINTDSSDEDIKTAFAKYGIEFSRTEILTFRLKFSDDDTVYSFSVPSGSKNWLLNDEKHVAIITFSGSIPVSASGELRNLFFSGIYPLVDGSVRVRNNETSASGSSSIHARTNIPIITEIEPAATDLLLVPFVGDISSSSSTFTISFIKDLYVCYQRQFRSGDIVVSSNGDKYISAGAWLLFKM